MMRPAPLYPGALVRVVAPSSPFDRARFDRGLALLQSRYRVHLSDGLFEHAGFLAGSDRERLQGLNAALQHAQTGALVAARGGYGATRLLPELDLALVRRANKWLVGFSDVTALHAAWSRADVCSIHGPMVCSLWEASAEVQQQWFNLLEGAPPAPLTDLAGLRGGRAAGRLFAGNLTVLAALAGTPHFPELDGAVLVVEDVTERPYRLDRALTSLLQSGGLRGVRAVVLGQFTQCEPGSDGVSAAQVLEERLGTLGVPLLSGAPVGHVPDNVPLLLGPTVEADAGAGTLSWT